MYRSKVVYPGVHFSPADCAVTVTQRNKVMSFNSEHMETIGMIRSGTEITTLPPQTEENDKVMKQLSWGLYGNTKYTDVQILYFMIKHAGNISAVHRDLGASHIAITSRIKRIPHALILQERWKEHGFKELLKKRKLRKPRKTTVTLDPTAVIQDINNGMTNTAIAMKHGVSKITITQFKQNRSLSVSTYKSRLFTLEEFVRVFVNFQGNRTKMAEFFGCSWLTIDYHRRSLYLPKRDYRMPWDRNKSYR